MTTLYSFPPVADAHSRLLILGSMPGEASLVAHQYYAHPRNAFWKILAAVVGFSADSNYADKVAAVKRQGIAIWDVLHSCQRPGSLDSNIVESSIVANDFPHFFKHHPNINCVLFNGGKAHAAFRKHVLPVLPDSFSLHFEKLPSTSPANASITYESKLHAWSKALTRLS